MYALHYVHLYVHILLWQVLIERFVGDSSELQMAVLYATQVFCYNHTFPKGKWGHEVELSVL